MSTILMSSILMSTIRTSIIEVCVMTTRWRLAPPAGGGPMDARREQTEQTGVGTE